MPKFNIRDIPPKQIGISLLVIIILIIIFQNTESTSIQLLFWTLSLPRIILFPLIFIAGYLTARILISRGDSKSSKKFTS